MSPTLEMPAAKAQKSKSKLSSLMGIVFLFLLIGFFVWLYSGRIVSNNGELSAGFVPITAPISSTINKVLIGPNAHVQAGQLLAKLDVGDYMQQLAAAKDLVRGTINTKENAAHIAEVQKATEDMVKRIALARHEEGMRKHFVEQSSIEHARAQLHMRNMETQKATPSQKENARKAEFDAEKKLQNAKAAFELASQSRSAIESELHKIRDSKVALRQEINMISPDISQIHAPINGYLTKNIPLDGQAFAMGETIFQIIPETGAKLYALAQLPEEKATKIPNNALCFVLPKVGFDIYEGHVASMTTNTGTVNVSINLKNSGQSNVMNMNNSTRTVFWVHPLANNSIVKYLLMALSYIPIP